MIRERLQTALLEEAQDTIARLVVENQKLTDTVTRLEAEREAEAKGDAETSGRSGDLAVGGVPSHGPSHQVVLLQQQLVEKELRVQMMEEQQRHLLENVNTLERMLQDVRRTGSLETSPVARMPAGGDDGVTASAGVSSASPLPLLDGRGAFADISSSELARQVRELQEEARHARESERNYARMVDALQQELVFTQRQLLKGRAESRRARGPSPDLAPHSWPTPAVALLPTLSRQCAENTAALATVSHAVSALNDRCAAVAHCDDEIIALLHAELREANSELIRLRQRVDATTGA